MQNASQTQIVSGRKDQPKKFLDFLLLASAAQNSKRIYWIQNTGVLGEHPLYGSPHGYAVSRAASAGTAENVPGCRRQSRNQDANVSHLRILPFPDGNALTASGIKKARK